MSLKKGAANYQELNTLILQKRTEAEKTIIKLETLSEETTILSIKEQIVGKKALNFFDYSYDRVERLKNTIAPSSYSTYRTNIKKVEKYFGHRNINFNDLDITFIKKFESYLFQEKGNQTSTVAYTFRIIKTLFNDAINEGVIDSNIYPFRNYKLKIPTSVKNYLNEEQFQALLNYPNNKVWKTDIYYDMFLFACYAGGLRFTDVLETKWNDYNESEHRISKRIRKTKRKHQFVLPKKAISIIDKYKNDNSEATDYIFPLLKNDFDYNIAPDLIYKAKTKYNQYANISLSEIGFNLELPFKLTFHTSRHTFATRALNKGMRIEHVSKILDHTKIVTTQIYAKIINKELDKAMAIMDD